MYSFFVYFLFITMRASLFNFRNFLRAFPARSIYVSGNLFRTMSSALNYSSIASLPPKVRSYVEEKANICKPDNIHICDGTENENKMMIDTLRKNGQIEPLSKYENWWISYLNNIFFLFLSLFLGIITAGSSELTLPTWPEWSRKLTLAHQIRKTPFRSPRMVPRVSWATGFPQKSWITPSTSDFQAAWRVRYFLMV